MNMNSTNITVPHMNKTGSVFNDRVLPVLYSLICVAGLVLNLLAIWIFLRVPSGSGLVVYLKNMVVADLLVLLSIPWLVGQKLDLGGWRLHMVVCRYTAVLFYSGMYMSIMFLGLISLERYVKIVHTSASAHLRNVGVARVLSAFTWGLVMLIMLPNSLLTSNAANEENARHCMRLKTKLGLEWHSASIYLSMSIFWVTFLLLGFCYGSIARHMYVSHRRVGRDDSGAHRKSNRSIISILLVFFVCFVPYHLCRIPYTMIQAEAVVFSKRSRFLLFEVKEGTLFLSALNVCLDPVIYFLMCHTFRESLLRKFSRKAVEAGTSSVTSVYNPHS